jgi:hypothetical protein
MRCLVHGASCPWGEMSMERVIHGASFVCGASCPLGELSMVRVVHGVSCPWDELSCSELSLGEMSWGELPWGQFSGESWCPVTDEHCNPSLLY